MNKAIQDAQLALVAGMTRLQLAQKRRQELWAQHHEAEGRVQRITSEVDALRHDLEQAIEDSLEEDKGERVRKDAIAQSGYLGTIRS